MRDCSNDDMARVLKFALMPLMAFICVISAMVFAAPQEALAQQGDADSARIHVMSFIGTDAIIIESNGHFGMVDSGESNDYPDGSDPRYPQRMGTTEGQGHEDEVVAYMQSLGITSENFEFYIGTHPHSDHIGSASTIIETFKPRRVYTQRYDDSYILNPNGLWDNQYVYDKLVAAAETVGASLILDYDEDASVTPEAGSTTATPTFYLGDALIQIMNTDPSYQTEGSSDGNWFSLGVKVTAGGQTAFLAGDICNFDGDEDELGPLIDHVDFLKLGHHGNPGSGTAAFIEALSPTVAFQTSIFWNMSETTLRALTSVGTRLYTAGEFAAAGVKAIVVEFANGQTTTNAPNFGLELRRNCYTKHYHAFENGVPVTLSGWYDSDAGQVFFDNSDESTAGAWIDEGDGEDRESIYVDPNGHLADGWQQVGDLWYYFKDGVTQTGWIRISDVWYYLRPGSGIMATGSVVIDGQSNIFSSSGAWLGVASLKGWNHIGDAWYYILESGENATGWLHDGNAWYYLCDDGDMATGWHKVNDEWYYFADSGVMQTDWVLDGSWYFLRSSGVMATGWEYIGSAWYYLTESGAMATGWDLIDGNWYYLSDSGSMATGWVHVKGRWYALSSSGVMQTGWFNDGAATYYLEKSGAMATGWLLLDYDWHFFDGSGALLTSCWIGNYYVDSDGIMARNTWIGSYYVGDDGLWVPGYK